ncbi:isoleucyl-tRNA synthetase [candidate division MSBL1 archaeon SCGC-AAA833F18]|uniref:Isoleucine--tRNA ligase n=1 Tax=candidate division MSBL1 archaeon SCGC-AAA833F18 TaxID=1698257 RepID=A0A133VSI3_9EURY|nr:isoleucyl-tRNA synthetase [candidate division MSBL1 archaeon SCGC-AAA833F18]
MIEKAPKKYDAPEREKEIRDWWNANNIYEKVKNAHSDDPEWFFLDGPPYASGSIHLGTAWNKLIKDSILRFKTMQGFDVHRQPGWDCHGLPIEVKVEEKLGTETKKDIEEEIGVREFIEECKKWAIDHVDLMSEQFEKLGVWMDWGNPYLTLTNDYLESAWWTLKKAYEKGLMEKQLQVIPWCPRCETALAEHEVRGEYRPVKDPSLYARFKLTYVPNEYLLVWTTTPWTLPANIAVCVNPEYYYAKVEADGDTYILAEPLVSEVMSALDFTHYRMIDLIEGKKLEGLRYEHPLLEEVPKQHEFKTNHQVICGDHVTLEEGTGCVHTAPGHGQEDFEIGKEYGLPVFSPVGPDGKFTEEAGKYAGKFVKNADEGILGDLDNKDVLMKSSVIRHSYPHCWRCGTPLIFRATSQWFLNIDKIRPQILEKNSEKVRWVPSWVGKRYVDGVESVGNWCISRQRYWGIPMPVWECNQCGSREVIGSRNELVRKATSKVEDIDLHRPDVDEVYLKCPSCDGQMERISDVLDVWFDSGVCSWASLGFPKQENEFKRLWPSDFITEGEDQVTKWFYSQQAASVIAFDDVPYKEALMHGFTLDEKGRKMSKSLGNVVEPSEVSEKHGADVLRFYMLHASPIWEDLRFNWKEVQVVNRLLNVIWNTYVFTTTYMSLDDFDLKTIDESIKKDLAPEDRWILSRANNLVKNVTNGLEDWRFHEVTKAIENFVLEDLSRWYIKLVRKRTWIERKDPIKLAAYWTLYQTFQILLKVLAPFMPHASEAMYQGLIVAADPSKPESVHLSAWPEPDENKIDEQLERNMEITRDLVEAGARARQEVGIKGRWPVQRVVIQTSSSDVKGAVSGMKDILMDQLNCKEILVLTPEEFSEEIGLTCRVDEDSLRDRYGGLTSSIKEIIQNMGSEEVRAQLKQQGFVGMQVEGQQVKVKPDEVSFGELPEEFVRAEFHQGEVLIDTTVTPKLRAERLSRDLVRRLQRMRKELDLEMEEQVDVIVGVDSEESQELLLMQKDYITREVRVRQLQIGASSEVGAQGYVKKWTINDEEFKLAIIRLPVE